MTGRRVVEVGAARPAAAPPPGSGWEPLPSLAVGDTAALAPDDVEVLGRLSGPPHVRLTDFNLHRRWYGRAPVSLEQLAAAEARLPRRHAKPRPGRRVAEPFKEDRSA
jgi:hypothetical protein